MTWGNSDLFHPGGQTWNYRSKPKVRSVKWFGKECRVGRVWVVTGHVLGPRRFYTWQEAMDYANFQTYYTINGAKV